MSEKDWRSQAKTFGEIDQWIKSAIDIKAVHLPKEGHYEFKKRKHQKWVPIEIAEAEIQKLENRLQNNGVYYSNQIQKLLEQRKELTEIGEELEGRIEAANKILNEMQRFYDLMGIPDPFAPKMRLWLEGLREVLTFVTFPAKNTRSKKQ